MTQSRIESLERHVQALRDERHDMQDLLLASDAMFGLIHEISNSLNSMMLQTSIVEMKVSGHIKEGVAEIRRLSIQAARQLTMVHQFRDQFRSSRSRIDLNQIVRELLADESGPADAVETALTNQPLVLQANTGALKRLIRLLIRIVSGSQSSETPLAVRTLQVDRQIALSVESVQFQSDDATSLDWDEIPDDGAETDRLIERLAVQSLARLVGTRLFASAGPAGELSVCMQWPDNEEGFAIN